MLSYCNVGLYAEAAEAQEAGSGLSEVQGFMVSENHGTIRDSYFAANNQGIIVHIQDLHCNFDAQMSISRIIDELIDKYDLKLVTVEGSIGEMNTAPFLDSPNERVKEQVARFFLKRGDLDGAAYAHIMRDNVFTFWGVDDKEMYADNIEAYKVSAQNEALNRRYYNNMKTIIDKFKSKVYSKQLKELDVKIQAYKSDKIDFAEYVSYLNNLMSEYNVVKRKYPNFKKLLRVFEKEAALDFEEVDTERSKYMEKLNEELDKEALAELLDKSLYFKLGKINAMEFYTYLKELSASKDVTPISKYPQLEMYVSYIKLYSNIDNIKLFKEIDAIEEALKEKLFMNDAQRKIDSLSRNLEVLNDLFNLKLTKETLQHYRDHRKELTTTSLINFITENAPKYKIKYKLDPSFRKIDAELPSLERFYQLAEGRDAVLVNNTLDKMREEKANLAVLVSGGFHTKGITDLLKERDLSYIVITPKVDNLQDDNPYQRVLLGGKDQLDILYDRIMAERAKN